VFDGRIDLPHIFSNGPVFRFVTNIGVLDDIEVRCLVDKFPPDSGCIASLQTALNTF